MDLESNDLHIMQQLARSRTMATVTDAPLDKKVEMTNWEKVDCFPMAFNSCKDSL